MQKIWVISHLFILKFKTALPCSSYLNYNSEQVKLLICEAFWPDSAVCSVNQIWIDLAKISLINIHSGNLNVFQYFDCSTDLKYFKLTRIVSTHIRHFRKEPLLLSFPNKDTLHSHFDHLTNVQMQHSLTDRSCMCFAVSLFLNKKVFYKSCGPFNFHSSNFRHDINGKETLSYIFAFPFLSLLNLT